MIAKYSSCNHDSVENGSPFPIFFRIMFHWTMEQPGTGTGKGSPQSPEMSHAIPKGNDSNQNVEAEQQQS